MPIQCDECGEYTNRFSSADYKRGQRGGYVECKDCIKRKRECGECGKVFRGRNERDVENKLEQHWRSHEVRAIECPLCHRNDRRYRTAADAMAHIESGFCASCKGESNAQQQIYNFTKQKAPHLTNYHALENGSYDSEDDEISYNCNMCNKTFGKMSSLMNHQRAKHANSNPVLLF